MKLKSKTLILVGSELESRAEECAQMLDMAQPPALSVAHHLTLLPTHQSVVINVMVLCFDCDCGSTAAF